MRQKKLLSLLLTASLGFAEIMPRGLVTDDRVKFLVYNANQVYRLVAYYGFQVDLQLADTEEPRTIAAGDSIGWQIVGSGHHIFIKPMASGARTNLSIITNKRTYIFDLVSRPPRGGRQDIAYLVKFHYPETLNSLSKSPSSKEGPLFNLDYKIAGSKEIEPLHVFDDGQFTFLEFDSHRELPAVFIVGSDGKESMVNYRMEGHYVIVERVADFFTFRLGKLTATAVTQRKFAQ